MLEVIRTSEQVLSPGQSVIFDTILLKAGCSECFRKNSSSINLSRRNAIYDISFNCNIGATAQGTGQIGITLNGSPLQETECITNTSAAGDLNNVSASTSLKTCCCGDLGSIALTNTGTVDLNIGQSPRLTVKINNG